MRNAFLLLTICLPMVAMREQSPNPTYEDVIGCWFKPHNATINLHFYRNRRFEFNDFNDTRPSGLEEETLTGRYELRGHSLILFYDDRPRQTFRMYQELRDTGFNWRIKGATAEYQFIKSNC